MHKKKKERALQKGKTEEPHIKHLNQFTTVMVYIIMGNLKVKYSIIKHSFGPVTVVHLF